MGNQVSGPSYEEIYRNANYIHGSVATPVCSEVMSVSRMYVRASELDPNRLKNPEIVKELYVFADVIFFDTNYQEFVFPGLEHLFFISRVFVWPQTFAERTTAGTVSIRLPWLNVPSSTIRIDQKQLSPLSLCFRAKHVSTAGSAPATFVLHAQQVVSIMPSTSTATMSIPQSQSNGILLQLQAQEGSAARGQNEEMWEAFPIFDLLRWEDMNLTLLWAMEATVLTAELILSYMTPSTYTVAEASLHVEWVNKLLIHVLQNKNGAPSDESLEHLFNTLLLQVQFILKMPSFGAGVIVPRLQCSTYRNLITTMANVAESYWRDFKQLILFINQNEVLGTFLLEQNKAFAEKERDMETFHSELHKVKTDDLNQALVTLTQLQVQMGEMSAEMEQAERDMEEGLRRFRNRQVARAFFSVLGSIVAVSSAFLTGGATAGTAVAATKNAVNQVTEWKSSLENIVDVLEKLLVVTDFLVAMKELTNAVKDVHEVAANVPARPDMPSELDWAIFENETEAVAAGMPEEVSEVLIWKTKCKNMAALGREMVTMAAVIGQLQYDIKVHDLLQEVARNQAERLEAIQPMDIKNYQEMATQLEMRTMKMLLDLLEVLSLQNAALRFQYLMPPSPVTMSSTIISMSDVWTMLLQQEAAAVVSLGELGVPTDREVIYVAKGIPVGVLLDGEDWDFSISAKEVDHFPSGWSRVRISYVEMRFVAASVNEEVHQPITETGKVYMVLRGEQFFSDRKRGEEIKYEAATPVEYQYAYALETGETTEWNRPTEEFANLFMRMTPFTRWKLRLSASARENQGLTFPTAVAADATTQIAIHFHVTAVRAVDWHTRHSRRS